MVVNVVGPLEMTARSVTGVNENFEPWAVGAGSDVPSAKVLIESFAGVTGAVGGFGVRKSSAWKQVAPMVLSDRKVKTSVQPATAGRGRAHKTKASRIPSISEPLVFIDTLSSTED